MKTGEVKYVWHTCQQKTFKTDIIKLNEIKWHLALITSKQISAEYKHELLCM